MHGKEHRGCGELVRGRMVTRRTPHTSDELLANAGVRLFSSAVSSRVRPSTDHCRTRVASVTASQYSSRSLGGRRSRQRLERTVSRERARETSGARGRRRPPTLLDRMLPGGWRAASAPQRRRARTNERRGPSLVVSAKSGRNMNACEVINNDTTTASRASIPTTAWRRPHFGCADPAYRPERLRGRSRRRRGR